MDMQIPNRNTLLHMAVQEDNETAVKFLLKHGADVNARLRSTKDTLHQRLSCDDNPEMREIFYRYRSSSFTTCSFSPNPISIVPGTSYTLNTFSGHRNRSLSNASETFKHHQPLHHHFHHHYNPHQVQQQKCPMPLHVAASHGKREILELLITYGGDVNAEMEGEYTPLIIAVLCKHLEAAELLINQGAKVNTRIKDGKTPTHFAVKTKQTEMVELLLRSGGDANARTEHGVTPLHIAVERKLQDVAELLLKNGSDVNATTKTGVTPLHCAAVKGQRAITEMILSYGGDVNVIMKKGKIDVTPLLWVTEYERKKITDILHKYVDKTNTHGFYGRFFKKIWKQFSNKKC